MCVCVYVCVCVYADIGENANFTQFEVKIAQHFNHGLILQFSRTSDIPKSFLPWDSY